MDLLILGGAALVAFATAAVPVLLWAALKRNSELRGALADAQDRLDLLEGRSDAKGRGAFVWSRPVAAPIDVGAPAAPGARTFRPASDPEPSEFASIGQHQKRGSGGHFSPTVGLMALGAGGLAAAALALAYLERIDPSVGAVLSLAACSAALIGAEWLNHVRHKEMPRGGIAALTAFALVAAVACGWYAATDLGLPPLVTLLVHGAAAFAALVYSRRYGLPMLALALAGALSTPALARSGIDVGNSPAVLGILVSVLGAIIWTARRRGLRAWCWTAAVGGIAWGIVATLGVDGALEVASTGAYLAAIATIGLIYASSGAAAPLPWPRLWTMRPKLGEPLLVGGGMAFVASAASIILFARAGEAAFWAAASIAALAGAAAVTAAFAEGLSLFALAIAIAAIMLSFGRWPDETAIALSAAILSVQVAIGGWLAAARARDPTPGALLAAFGPLVAIIVAYIRVGPLGGPELWAGAAGALAALNLLFFVRMRTLPRGATAAAIFLAGGGLAAAAAIVFAAPGWLRFPALAMLCLALAVADRRLDHRALRFAAVGAVLAALAISVADMRSPVSFQFAPWLEPASPMALTAAALLYSSGRFFGRGQERLYAVAAQVFTFCAAGAVAVAVISQTLRLDGDAHLRLFATGAGAVGALTIAAGLTLHFGPRPRLIAFVAEAVALALAVLLTLGVNGVVLNPWWGLRPAPVHGAPLINELMLAYAAPALGLILYGWVRARQNLLLRANATAAVGLALPPIWLSLELRRLFHPENMAVGPTLPAEGVAITLVWLAFAGGLALLARFQAVRPLRIVGYLLAFAALAKLAVADLAAFEGAAKIVGFILVAAAAIGLIVLFGRRALFGASSMTLDPNLAPPK